MRSRLVIEFDTTITEEKCIANKIAEAAMKILRRSGGYIVNIQKDEIPMGKTYLLMDRVG